MATTAYAPDALTNLPDAFVPPLEGEDDLLPRRSLTARIHPPRPQPPSTPRLPAEQRPDTLHPPGHDRPLGPRRQHPRPAPRGLRRSRRPGRCPRQGALLFARAPWLDRVRDGVLVEATARLVVRLRRLDALLESEPTQTLTSLYTRLEAQLPARPRCARADPRGSRAPGARPARRPRARPAARRDGPRPVPVLAARTRRPNHERDRPLRRREARVHPLPAAGRDPRSDLHATASGPPCCASGAAPARAGWPRSWRRTRRPSTPAPSRGVPRGEQVAIVIVATNQKQARLVHG